MPRPLSQQVVVITGASSGIGRATAVEFGRHQASVVLAARNEAALRQVADEIEYHGGRAHVVVTDVSQWEQVERLAGEASHHFGRIDTWVNDAAIYLAGTVADCMVQDIERMIQVDLMGQIYGMKAVLPYMITQGEGTIINVGSALSKRSAPLLAAYSAAKHGIKGFTDALRVELARDHPGINVTLVMPASINTPFFTHARSRMHVKVRPLPPVYAPETVAEAIVSAAVQPQREIYIGGAAKMLSASEAWSPALTDRMMLAGDLAFRTQYSDEPVDGIDNFDAPIPGPGSTTGEFGSETIPVAPYTRYFETQNPNLKRLMTAGFLFGTGVLLGRLLREDGDERTVAYEPTGQQPYPATDPDTMPHTYAPVPEYVEEHHPSAYEAERWQHPELPPETEAAPRGTSLS